MPRANALHQGDRALGPTRRAALRVWRKHLPQLAELDPAPRRRRLRRPAHKILGRAESVPLTPTALLALDVRCDGRIFTSPPAGSDP